MIWFAPCGVARGARPVTKGAGPGQGSRDKDKVAGRAGDRIDRDRDRVTTDALARTLAKPVMTSRGIISPFARVVVPVPAGLDT